MVLSLLSGALDDRTPRDAVREWVIGGLPAGAAHDPAVKASVDGAPSTVGLDVNELAALGAALDVPLPSSVTVARAALRAGEQALRSRGILVDGWKGAVLAPAYLPTIGVALWAERSFTVIETGAATAPDPAASAYRVFGTAGGRCAELRRNEGGWSVATTTLEAFAAELNAAIGIGPGGGGVVGGLSLACRWRAPDDVTPDDDTSWNETILIWPEPPGVRWQVGSDDAPARQLGADEARAAIRAALDRGAEADRRAAGRLIEAAKLASRRWWNPVGGSTVGDAIVGAGLDWLWHDPKADARELALLERRRQEGAAAYWGSEGRAASFVRR